MSEQKRRKVRQTRMNQMDNTIYDVANYLAYYFRLFYLPVSVQQKSDFVCDIKIYGLNWCFQIIGHSKKGIVKDVLFLAKPNIIWYPNFNRYMVVRKSKFNIGDEYCLSFCRECANIVKGIMRHPFISFYCAFNNNNAYYHGSYIGFFVNTYFNFMANSIKRNWNIVKLKIKTLLREDIDSIKIIFYTIFRKIEGKFRK